MILGESPAELQLMEAVLLLPVTDKGLGRMCRTEGKLLNRWQLPQVASDRHGLSLTDVQANGVA
jgi:hypothetical protein